MLPPLCGVSMTSAADSTKKLRDPRLARREIPAIPLRFIRIRYKPRSVTAP